MMRIPGRLQAHGSWQIRGFHRNSGLATLRNFHLLLISINSHLVAVI